MAQFTPSSKQASDFNNGNEYVNHVDSPSAEDFNNVIESQLYTQGLATNQPDTSEAGNVGTPSVEIITASDGSARMKFKNLKGATGTTGQTGATGNDGTSIYTTNNILVTSGTGTISRTDISIPSGHNAQVGDLIMDTQGTLVRITSANVSVVSYEFYSSLTANSPKSLYNLGAYDTFVDNGDGTATITRKTGYIKLDGTEEWHDYSERGIIYHDLDFDIYDKSVCNYPTIGTVYVALGNNVNTNRVHLYGVSSLSEGIAIISKTPISIQYELATSYTEEVILDQPIHTIDQHGEQWLRDEWGKSININDYHSSGSNCGYSWTYDESDQTLTFNGTQTNTNYYVINFKSGLKAQSYTAVVQVISGESSVADGLRFGFDGNSGYILTNCTTPGTYYAYTPNAGSSFILMNSHSSLATVTNLKIKVALYEGNVAYPYQPYNGKIIHEADLETATVDNANKLGNVESSEYALKSDLIIYKEI